MKRELLILRHAKSDWSLPVDDFHRPLKKKGRRTAQRLGAYLWREGIRPDRVVSSPAERAKDTAEMVCAAMGLPNLPVVHERRLYEADAATLLRVLASCPPGARRVMIVGHNPGLEELLLHLVADRRLRDADNLLPTAALARVALSAPWSDLPRGAGSLLGLVRPKDLPDLFPFPAPDGPERRQRPAYYYEQSAAIAYRSRSGRTEILLIGAGNGHRLSIPKGVVEPGFTPPESAAREAFEEAGVKGRVGTVSLGTYRIRKWGARCSVKVYPMLVTKVLTGTQWAERHRRRTWVSPARAVDLLGKSPVVPLLRRFELLLAKRAPTVPRRRAVS